MVALVVIALGLWIYAFKIEPAMLKVEKAAIKVQAMTNPMKIAIFSDVHLGNGVDTNRLNAVVDKLNAMKADAVVFLGDFYDNYSKYTGNTAEDTAALLRIDAPVKLAVWGNHDMGGGAHKIFPSVMKEAGFDLLENEFVDVGEQVRFSGVQNVTFGAPDTRGLRAEGRYNILLCHEPDFGEGEKGFDLQLSGHSHGGQVYLPFIGAPILPEDARVYVRGMYEKEDGKVYVTRGIGMSILPYRFGSIPEITLITLEQGS